MPRRRPGLRNRDCRKGSLRAPPRYRGDHCCGQSCGQDVKEMCSISEIMHKILGHCGNFVLSLSAIQASIFLHAKAPDGGGSGPPKGFRPGGKQPKVLSGLTTQGTAGCGDPGRLRFPANRRSEAFGRNEAGSRPSGQGSPVPTAPSGVGGTGSGSLRSGAGGFLGDCLLGAGGRVALQFLITGLGGVGLTLHRHLPAMAAPLPRVGELASPGRRDLSRGSAGFHGRRGFACEPPEAQEEIFSEVASRNPGSGGMPCAAA